MKKYNGEEKPFNSIPVGAVVEFDESTRALWKVYAKPMRYTGLYKDGHYNGYALAPTPAIGIKKSSSQVQFYLGDGKFVPELSYWPEAIPSSTIKAKELSPEAAEEIKKFQIEFLKKNLPVFRKHSSFTNGCDPEIFVEDQDGNVLFAWEFLPGKLDQKNRFEFNLKGTISRVGGGYAKGTGSLAVTTGLRGSKLYWDGVQGEFTVRAGECFSTVVDEIHAGLKATIQLARKKFPSARLSAKSVISVPKDVLKMLPAEYTNFGCMPSLNAYGEKHIVPVDCTEIEDRPAGGHIHLSGISILNESTAPQNVKWIDRFAGVACVGLFAGYDDPRRRVMYGRAGEYRLPKHGLEYRVLSNAWLMGPAITHLVYDLVRGAICAGQLDVMELWESSDDETCEAINKCEVGLAREIIKRNEKLFLYVMNGMADTAALGFPELRCKNGEFGKAALEAVYQGLGFIYKQPTAIEHNWGIDDSFDWVMHSEGESCQWVRICKGLLKGERV